MTASEKPSLPSEREQGHGPSEQAGLWVLSFGCPLHIGAIEAGTFSYWGLRSLPNSLCNFRAWELKCWLFVSSAPQGTT